MAHTDINEINGFTIRKLHSPDGNKRFGYLTLPADYDGADPTKIVKSESLMEALIQAGFLFNDTSVDIGIHGGWKFQDVDKVNGFIIRRLQYRFQTIGALAYMVIPTESGMPVKRFETLTAAREHCGWKPAEVPVEKRTKPKRSNPQNLAGYDPHSNRAGK